MDESMVAAGGGDPQPDSPGKSPPADLPLAMVAPVAAAAAAEGDDGDAAQINAKMKLFSVKTALVGSLGGLLFGYDLGVVASALPQLARQFELSVEEKELVVGILLAGCVIGAFLGGYATDKYGRKVTIMITDCVFIVGALIIALAPNLGVILLGRFIVGMGVSVSAIADVAYLTEVAPNKWRGAIVSVNELMISGGFMLANFIGWSFTEADVLLCCLCTGNATLGNITMDVGKCLVPVNPAGCAAGVGQCCNTPPVTSWPVVLGSSSMRLHTINKGTEGWRIMFGFAAVIAGGQLVGMTFMPKSPRWLLLHGKYYDALGVLKQIYITKTAAEEEVKVISAAAEKELDVLRTETMGMTLKRWRAQLAVGVLLFFFAQFSGQSNVLSYAPEMFANAGMDPEDAAGMGVFIGIGKFLCTCICVWKVDEVSRRGLLLIGTVVMAFALLLMMFNFHGVTTIEKHHHGPMCGGVELVDPDVVKPNPIIGLIAMMSMAASYSVSFGPLGWLITSEMFSTGVRGRAIGVVTVGNWLFNLAVSGTFESMVHSTSYTTTFGFYFVLMLVAIAWERAYVPETRHMEPEDVVCNDIFDCKNMPQTCLAGYSSQSRGVMARGADEQLRKVIKTGTMRKLGGKAKDKWEERHFELSKEGLRWDTSMSFKDSARQLKTSEMSAVTVWSDIGIQHAFEVCTRVKDGKVYKFSAVDEAQRDGWIAAIQGVIGDVEPGAGDEELGGTDTTVNELAEADDDDGI